MRPMRGPRLGTCGGRAIFAAVRRNAPARRRPPAVLKERSSLVGAAAFGVGIGLLAWSYALRRPELAFLGAHRRLGRTDHSARRPDPANEPQCGRETRQGRRATPRIERRRRCWARPTALPGGRCFSHAHLASGASPQNSADRSEEPVGHPRREARARRVGAVLTTVRPAPRTIRPLPPLTWNARPNGLFTGQPPASAGSAPDRKPARRDRRSVPQ